MGKRFKEFVVATRSFFAVRFIASFLIAFVYILIAAGIQGLFVGLLGENTFNYIVGGLLSLFLGVLFCRYIGALCFMFVKGWHVASLPYVDNILELDLSAFDVGLTAFKKNLVSFGAVYTVRSLLTGVIESASKKLDRLLEGLPFAAAFTNVSKNGIVQYVAKDVLHYMFDATVFYIVKHPTKSVGDIPSTAFTAVRRYLCCLPSMMLSSVTAYILFRLLPNILRLVLIVLIFITQGFVAGILISVLLYPVFYILDNALFDPLTMLMFLSVFSEKCEDKEEGEGLQAIVNGILDGIDTEEGQDEQQAQTEEEAKPVKETSPEVKENVESQDEEPEAFPTPKSGGQQGVSQSQLQALAAMSSTMEASLEDLEMEDEEFGSNEILPEFFEESEPQSPRQTGAGLGALLNRSADGLDEDPLAGQYDDE